MLARPLPDPTEVFGADFPVSNGLAEQGHPDYKNRPEWFTDTWDILSGVRGPTGNSMWMNQMAIIRSIHRIQADPSAGITTSPEDNPSLIGATTAAIWSDTHLTHTFVRRKGGPEVNRMCECLERVIGFCPQGKHMLILIGDHLVFSKWVEMQEAAKNNFAGMSPDEWEGWPMSARLVAEHRHITLRRGAKEDHPKFWEATLEYAREIVNLTEEEEYRGLDGTPVPLAHC
jgi:hypothetical protein